ncbi:MAG TPA: hypothetical protein VF719_08885 [Abditibacteriaceae bacterium]
MLGLSRRPRARRRIPNTGRPKVQPNYVGARSTTPAPSEKPQHNKSTTEYSWGFISGPELAQRTPNKEKESTTEFGCTFFFM